MLYLGQMAVSGPASDFDRQSAVEYMTTGGAGGDNRGLLSRATRGEFTLADSSYSNPASRAPRRPADPPHPGDIALSDAELTTVAPELLAESLPDYFRAWARRIRNGGVRRAADHRRPDHPS